MRRLLALLILATLGGLLLHSQQLMVIKKKAAAASPPELVEVVYGVADATTHGYSVTLGTATTAGELVVVHTHEWYTAGTCGNTNTDSASSTYTQVWAVNVEYGLCSKVTYLENAPSGITSIIVSGLTDHYGATIVGHWKNIATTGALDQVAASTNTDAGTPWSSATVTTTSAASLLVGIVDSELTTWNSGNQDALASTGSWTMNMKIVDAHMDAANGSQMGMSSQIVSSIQTNIANTGTNNGSTNVYANHAGILTFKGL